MRRFGKFLGRVILALVCIVGAVWVFGPTEPVERGAPFAGDLSDPVAHLAAREAAFDDITPGAEARILWAGAPGDRTPQVVLYVHGFSATSEEIRPLPDELAAHLGANLVFARLTGHGRDGAAMAQATAGNWIDDVAEALAVARAVGDEIVVIGTSTGATLTAVAVTEPDMAQDIAGVVMMSPNFALASPAGRMLAWPGARIWVPWLVGADQSFAAQNDAHATYWTMAYPTVASLPMAALLEDVAARDFSTTGIPLLVLFSEQDRVISHRAVRGFAERWGGPVTLVPLVLPEAGTDPYKHVIAGDILSPVMTAEAVATLTFWADQTFD